MLWQHCSSPRAPDSLCDVKAYLAGSGPWGITLVCAADEIDHGICLLLLNSCANRVDVADIASAPVVRSNAVGRRGGRVLDAQNHQGKFGQDYIRALASAAGLLVYEYDLD